jgi:DNA-binding transcriptional LysR family regulator
LAPRAPVRVEDLLSQPLVGMRSGYVMHRFLYRLLDGQVPSISYSTDGAEMGKLMVAEGLGVTVLPDFSVAGDPLERRGLITYRPLDLGSTDAGVRLVVQRRRSGSVPQAARDLHRILVERARSWGGWGVRHPGAVVCCLTSPAVTGGTRARARARLER